MGKLSIEERAKRYDEALDRAKIWKDKSGMPKDKQYILDDIFPELKESGDEKMRKTLIEYFKKFSETYSLEPSEINPKKAIAWLEKQGEQKLPIEKLPSEMKSIGESLGFTTQEECDRYNEMVTNLIMSDDDKVEPKFKVGDWIVFNGLTLYVKEVVKGFYRTVSNGGIPNSYDWDIDNVARLWTIQDAKDGDVLFMDNGAANCIFIYKSFNNGIINKYASYNNFGFEGEHYLVLNDGYVIPATKEQCDLLFQKMKEASYVWDDEKKELRKIKHDVQLTEFEHALKDMMNTYRDAIGDNDVTIEEVKERAKYMLSLINPKSAWGEEDEHWRQKAVDFIKHLDLIRATPTLAKDTIDWLKSIKDRALPQPKQEWSEKDEHAMYLLKDIVNHSNKINERIYTMPLKEKLYDFLKSLKDRALTNPKQEWSKEDERTIKRIDSLLYAINESDLEDIHAWLKSLRPQNTWKPSDEQIYWLKWAINRMPDTEKANEAEVVLKELLEELEKLL